MGSASLPYRVALTPPCSDSCGFMQDLGAPFRRTAAGEAYAGADGRRPAESLRVVLASQASLGSRVWDDSDLWDEHPTWGPNHPTQWDDDVG